MGRVKTNLPPERSMRMLYVTRAQWERMFVMHGSPENSTEGEKMPKQIQLW
jgi:CRISPR/Cas system-associated protein endoribonuclease Cas2